METELGRIVVPDYGPTYLEPSPFDPDAPAFSFRTEQLKKLYATVTVDRRVLEDSRSHEYILRDVHRRLRDHLEWEMNKAGRMPHGEVTIDQHEDHLRDVVSYRATVITRESDQGEWPSIYAALREDGIL
jgi:hypothetical protein